MNNLKVEYVPIDSVKPYEKNAKIHTAEQIEQIKNSINQFGMVDPIGVWHDTIVEGHGRYIACQELGMDTIPVVKLDHLTDKQRKAYAIAHNKLTMNTNFENELLGEDLKELMDEIDMVDLGFGEFELTMLTEDFKPDEYDKDLINEYSGNEQQYLAKKRIIITYSEDDEEKVLRLIGVDAIDKVVYDITEIS